MKYLVLLSCLIILSCNSRKNEKLPVVGESYKNEKGEIVYHRIPDFRFMNQDSVWITNESFKNKIYVADFFFTSCPTICPKMKTQMLRIYGKFKEEPKFSILSHTIDPEYDTIPLLKSYSARLGVNKPDKWHFVTGNMDDLHLMAEKYFSTAKKDSLSPGGYMHSGAFALVDKNRLVRGVYDGTDPERVDQLMKDIEILLKEE